MERRSKPVLRTGLMRPASCRPKKKTKLNPKVTINVLPFQIFSPVIRGVVSLKVLVSLKDAAETNCICVLITLERLSPVIIYGYDIIQRERREMRARWTSAFFRAEGRKAEWAGRRGGEGPSWEGGSLGGGYIRSGGFHRQQQTTAVDLSVLTQPERRHGSHRVSLRVLRVLRGDGQLLPV